MRNAYDHNVRKLWIANVHDPKVAAYDLELFLDMAWNIDGVESENVGKHLQDWLTVNFGKAAADKLYPRCASSITSAVSAALNSWVGLRLNLTRDITIAV